MFLLLASQMPAQDKTQPPGQARVKFVTKGVGVQIYTCAAKGATYQWVLQEPQADLLDAATSEHVGTHSKGPTWTWKDGSSITGTVAGTEPSPRSTTDIPWLLLQTKGDGAAGALSEVTYVRRSNTDGGVAPVAGCDELVAGTATKVPYTATYTFYTTSR